MNPAVVALQREREGYVQRGLDDRVAEVDAELERLGSARPAATDVEEAGGGSARRRSGRRGG